MSVSRDHLRLHLPAIAGTASRGSTALAMTNAPRT
jgi:hypothetical protein